MAGNKPEESTIDRLAAFDFTTADITVKPPKTRPVREIPANVVAFAQRLLDSKEKVALSFKGDLELATAFFRDIKDAGPHTTPPSTVVASQDGIVVNVSVGEKRGRKGGEKTPANDENKSE